MSLPIINSSTVTKFIEDADKFDGCINECFEKLDVDGDGLLSREELSGGFGSLLPVGSVADIPREEIVKRLCDTIFERFDEDQNGKLDPKEFKSLSMEMMLAMARGIGSSPVHLAVNQGSLLMKAIEHELATTS
ncbi:hypothetical protein FNV43_RR04798 [Rhamnella rubrinervis]|uniref:EF-hand domain-containing protein n=1 Tax=Rhamnella rubrinervis TaxID=2594499 RepID=A0A8K0HK75_9ROSA|nr:hypothetical protein FNV43_RR04798 [Rhamnella rubrinervis]